MRPSAWLENVSPHMRESKTVLDSGFRAVDSRFFVNGTYIPKSNSWWDFLSWIPDSKAGDSRFHNQNFVTFRFSQATFSVFRNPYSLTWGKMWLQDLPDRIKIKSMFCFCFSDDRLKRFRERKQRRIRVENQVCTDTFWVDLHVRFQNAYWSNGSRVIAHVTDASPSLGAHTTA